MLNSGASWSCSSFSLHLLPRPVLWRPWLLLTKALPGDRLAVCINADVRSKSPAQEREAPGSGAPPCLLPSQARGNGSLRPRYHSDSLEHGFPSTDQLLWVLPGLPSTIPPPGHGLPVATVHQTAFRRPGHLSLSRFGRYLLLTLP